MKTSGKGINGLLLRSASYVLALMLGIIGIAGCCRDQPVAEYGPQPLYGPVIVPDVIEEIDDSSKDTEEVNPS
jgi:hypothetical protein